MLRVTTANLAHEVTATNLKPEVHKHRAEIGGCALAQARQPRLPRYGKKVRHLPTNEKVAQLTMNATRCAFAAKVL